MLDIFVKFLDAIYEIIATIFRIAFYIVLMIFALPIYFIALVCLCIVWSFMIIKYLITG